MPKYRYKNIESVSERHKRRLLQKAKIVSNDDFEVEREGVDGSCCSGVTEQPRLSPEHIFNENENVGHTSWLQSDISDVQDEDIEILEPLSDSEDEQLPIDFDFSTFRNELSTWASDIPQSKVNSLLKILKSCPYLKELPSDCRTLLKTPRHTEVRKMGCGVYAHLGLRCLLLDILQNNYKIVDSISLQINVDGLPISKSSGSQLWPILIAIVELPEIIPFPVGVYHGKEKPESCDDFMGNFIDELCLTLDEGINVGSRNIKVSVHSFVCDAPARAFLLQIKSHTAYSSCPKCTVEGDYIKNRVSFLDSHCSLRTNESFREKRDDIHHVGTTPLLKIPNLDIVAAFPIDYMHLICLGVMRKVLLAFTKGSYSVRLSSQNLNLINLRLEHIVSFVSSDFVRKPRSLKELLRWKATEFRQFLLYTGPFVLNGSVCSTVFQHFLCLHTAVRILISKELISKYVDYAEELLLYFVENFPALYGEESVSHNVHNLIHITSNVKSLGPLDVFSAFKFENRLQTIKKVLRKPDKPLQQLCRRLTEQSSTQQAKKLLGKSDIEGAACSKSVKNAIPLGFTEPAYSYIKCNGFKIAAKPPNDCVIMDSGDIVVIRFIGTCNGSQVILGQKFETVENFFLNPCASTKVGIYKAGKLLNPAKWPISKVKGKALRVPMGLGSDVYFVAELLHSLHDN
ncbi:uncharacterized protein LOC124165677 isoform X1 [Ischnura elegans]|uniref:uncharacterized protein LOC124156053 n=1 Tax=Ischnura elegans TaxID=197161 RepID=UPI001ED89FEE|nr:uncharacterized protein LOC124156053 [Ischnura elegans]XP_046393888.1 uncharacterized protein LOC124161555 isoform X1 [Ischnura elegans]XP_046393890.1 uncharacterized protein LOC124161555 isoform X1 [Ischnura elegans]XP_046399112.1 uncharacterized protein LOC124165677 isoform X1 [Ischnura elegans]XP_046399113.1 uncharacterized protein LOC124165677 isoform X1 [Ischnura elegans]